ncbi:MAG: lytic transglycosylase domain-containing protein [Deltaproteobacteria bacterium]|nr:lytic transglycosylase domain-containing protein [Deltaproteobacteria bacterium]
MTNAWENGWLRRGGPHILLPLVAMLVSGCFHVGPSAKQAMTSAAPGAAAGARANAKPDVPSALGDVENPAVQSRVTAFQTHLRGFFDGALTRGAKYLPSMRDILVREGLPAELAYLPLIESGYRPQAVSPAGAAGPWQFIPATGRRYGLRIDSLVDERRDPIKSTQAASAYLKDLHGMFGDWELSLAAYNTGEYRVARILANKDVDDYWDMRERGYLPSETSAYVPKFLAAVQIAMAPEDYGFETPTDHTPEHYEMVDVDRMVSLRAAAELCGVTASELAELNPALRSGITPSGYSLRVPAGKAEPLRIGLATYVEPVHPRRQVVRSARGGRNGRSIAKGSRSTAVAQGKRSATQIARTAPRRYQRGRRDVQTAHTRSATVREAKVDTRRRVIERGKPPARQAATKPAKSGPSAKSTKPAKKAASGKRRG